MKPVIPVQTLPSVASAAEKLERLFPPTDESSVIAVSCRPGEYSASRIAHAVEDVNAHLLNLNVTSDSDRLANLIVAELRVSHRDPETVARSLERYGFQVTGVESAARLPDDSLMRSRYDELMHYLNL